MECPDCVLLEEKFLRNPSERERYEKELNLHWEYQESFRDKYCQTIVKAVENSDFDLSMHIDGAAPDGMNYSPFYFKDITGEPAQHCCLRTHNTFVKIHGWGRIVFQSYPQLESQSSNMVIEIILRSIQLYLTKTNKKAVRNIYLQMDNASPNKSNVLIAALCCLPLLGICRKVKLSYLVRGHSHTDGDGDIGIAGSYISTKNLQTFEDFADAVKSAFRSKSSGFTEVERIIGATDYIAMFPEYERNNYDMHGLTTAHSIRIVTDDEGVSPYVTYYDNLNHGSEAWFPRPAPAYPCGNWKEIFAHPSDPLRHGFPISGTCTPVALKGKRQHWQYYISYVSGDTQQFMLPCPSLPFPLTRSSIIERFRHTVRQDMRKNCVEVMGAVERSILTLLSHRMDEEKIPAWNTFFANIPHTSSDMHCTYINAFVELATQYGGEVVSKRERINFCTLKSASDYIDPITFSGGPISRDQRKKVKNYI